ncbi:MAG: hypothetical protein FWE62_04070, partial [Firmicutes bacterium]|nr:hypothetical protein [Bacillota bacterium]
MALHLLKGYTRQEKRGVIFAYALLAFPIAQFLVFYLYINFSSIVLSFLQPDGKYGFWNFQKIFQHFKLENGATSLTMSVLRSMLTWGISIFITFPLSVLFTYALFKKIPGEMVFRIIFILPSLLGGVVTTRMYSYIVTANGPLLEIAKRLGFEMSGTIYRDGLLGSTNTAFA